MITPRHLIAFGLRS